MLALSALMLSNFLTYKVLSKENEVLNAKVNLLNNEVVQTETRLVNLLDYAVSMKSQLTQSKQSVGNKNFYPDGTFCYRGVIAIEKSGLTDFEYVDSDECGVVSLDEMTIDN